MNKYDSFLNPFRRSLNYAHSSFKISPLIPTTIHLTGIDDENRIKAEEGVRKMGHNLIYLSPEEMKLWHDAVKPIHEKWIGEMEAKGLSGRKVYNEAKRLAEKYAE